jgi:hypothetical protein
MRVNKLLKVCLLYSCFVAAASLFSSSNVASFMNVAYQPRSEALGVTGVSHQSGSSSVYWNPGRLGVETKNDISANYYKAFETDFVSLQGLWHWKHIPIGLVYNQASIDGFSYSSINEDTGRVVLSGGTYDYHAEAVTVASGKKITDVLSVGVGIKLISEEASTVNATGVGADLGVFLDLSTDVKVGFLYQNIIQPTMRWNTESSLEEQVASVFRVGVSTYWFNRKLGVHQEAILQEGRSSYINSGINYWVHRLLDVQFGINQKNISVGLSLNLHPIEVGFSWTSPEKSYVDDYYKLGLSFNL